MIKKYFIHTFGCHESEADSERIAGDYEARGFTAVDSWKQADEIILNTCSVRQSTEDNVISYIGEIEDYFKQTKIQKPKLIFTGCMTHHGAEEIMAKIPFVDEVLSISEVGFNNQAVRRDKKHAWVQISSGCNAYCTFCVIPFSRGREISRPIQDIVGEVSSLAKKGYSEITLLGMNTNSYGLEKDGKTVKEMLFNLDKRLEVGDVPDNRDQYQVSKSTSPFVKLLRRLSKIDPIKKIDFLTSNVWDFSDELIEEVTTNPKISKHFHLPVQSGSDRILKLMNRSYFRKDCLNLINKIRAKLPQATFSTDYIVGFPTETDSEFEESVSLAKEIGWQSANVYYYSPRTGTLAYRLYPDDIPLAVKKRRRNKLDKLVNHESGNV